MTDPTHGQDGQGDTPQYGEIVARWAATTVIEAPEHALITLELIRNLDTRALWTDGNRLYLGDDPQGREVIYRVVGWDADQHALIVKRIAP